ncbi:SDR family oxidoreductase [Streptomyces bacillaris]|uniref:SDR family NAD(P)-dependent oxidoreductase n=1 Tax=Streptomyces cavourensis TaxID=67258 RepID=A0AAD0Q6Y0_9ACTN|nr:MULTISPECIES: SDR family oxidoreductase [Streptomyces]NUW23181.1 SDR family oxidoreductase [Streptomyces roseoviolaceus]ATY97528.1 NAD(P)-dependent oxidoreductase [Streptomyces cavourensis]AXI73353.1 SDR family NAD(P)-dependent oxidoreductase [Streptomyces cavourensis]MBH0242270.1 SDR family oxidoreductase [Streptomyces cavourensis]NUV88736.1 SDR family oxidoreductase [Streptomyces sp. KAI-26]
MSIVVTGATGELGRLVIDELLATVPAGEIAAVVRDKEKAAPLAARGVELRIADYNRPETLAGAFRSGDRVLLISGSEVGKRVAQHTAIVEAAEAAGVAQLAYTGILGGPDADFALADEHKATERLILDSGLPYTFLRNGWYTENYTANLAPVLAHGAVVSNAGEGRVASASRADYAAAAAAAVTGEGHLGKAYELSGDTAWSFAEYAALLSEVTGREITYNNVPAAVHQEILVGAGLPEGFAAILTDVDEAIGRGRLAGTSGDLARLIGRPTTPLATTVRAALDAA